MAANGTSGPSSPVSLMHLPVILHSPAVGLDTVKILSPRTQNPAVDVYGRRRMYQIPLLQFVFSGQHQRAATMPSTSSGTSASPGAQLPKRSQAWQLRSPLLAQMTSPHSVGNLVDKCHLPWPDDAGEKKGGRESFTKSHAVHCASLPVHHGLWCNRCLPELPT